MKKLILLSLALLITTGCANYVVTLNDGSKIGTKGKPKREGPVYVFKDSTGTEQRVSAGSVAEIAPASMAEDPDQKFQYRPTK